MQIAEHIDRPRGEIWLRVYRGGQLVDSIREENLIVDVSRSVLAELVGGNIAGNSVTTIGFGVGSTPASPDDTSLTGAYLKAVDGISYPAAGEVEFAFSLASTEANGLQIREFGLLTAGGRLWSRRVRASAIGKDEDLSLTGGWKIIF